jgi:hypothetical protein
MSEESVYQLEREVESARAKLTRDLSRLRLPETSENFTRTLKEEATSSLQSTIQGLIEEVKARAAANPAAALAIGAGLAWRLLRHPPIATALIGAGLISLFRTVPSPRHDEDYFSQAKTRLRQQAGEVAGLAAQQASAMSETVTRKTADLAASANERMHEWASGAAAASKEVASGLQRQAIETASGLQTKAIETASGLQKQAAETASGLRRQAGEAATGLRRQATEITGQASEAFNEFREDASRRASQAIRRAMDDTDTNDKLLLGAAGIAVVAALTIAAQRRMSDADR